MKKKTDVKKDKLTFKEMWANPRYNSLIKLGGYVIFFVLVFIYISIGKVFTTPEDNNNKENQPVILNYTKMKNNLIESNLNIKYKIGNYYISGTITNDVLNATLETNDSNTIYKIKYDGVNLYQVIKGEEVINSEILMDINLNYLIPDKIIEIIDDPSVIVTKSSDEKTYSYTVNAAAISLYLSDTAINKAIVLDNQITYDLEYSNINS